MRVFCVYHYNYSVSSPIIIIIGDVDRSGEGRVSLFGITVGGIVFRFFGDICHGHTDTIPSTLTHYTSPPSTFCRFNWFTPTITI